MRLFLISIHILFGTIYCLEARARPLEKGKIAAAVGLVTNKVDTSQSPLKATGLGSTVNWGAFVQAQGGLTSWLAADLVIAYQDVQFIGDAGSFGFANELSHRFHIPVLLRAWLLDFLSFGLGFYGSYRIGSIKNIDSNIPALQQTSAHDPGEHGVESSLAIHFPFGIESYEIGLDLRHGYSLTPRSGEARNWNSLLISLRQLL